MIESLGSKLRRKRLKFGLTLDDLAARTGISKPYLSLIETGRVTNPPSDEKLRRLEQTLGFATGELVSQAHLLRTPSDVRAVLQKLIQQSRAPDDAAAQPVPAAPPAPASAKAAGVDLDTAYLNGVLQDLVEKSVGNVERIQTNAVPVINRVSAGYPKDFTDLSYPRGVADDYVACPEVHDVDAFAARVHGDSMTPKYREGDIVIFSPATCPRNGDDCFIRFADGQTTFKRVFFESDEADASVVRLQPRNEKYRPQTVPSEQITGIYRAVFKYQRVDD